MKEKKGQSLEKLRLLERKTKSREAIEIGPGPRNKSKIGCKDGDGICGAFKKDEARDKGKRNSHRRRRHRRLGSLADRIEGLPVQH